MINESVYSGAENSPLNIIQAFFKKLTVDEERDEIDLTKINIHKVFYEYQKDNGFPLKDFYFNGNAVYPFSQQIEDVLYEMTVCGALTRPNPTMIKYNFVSLSETCYENLDRNIKTSVNKLVESAKIMMRG